MEKTQCFSGALVVIALLACGSSRWEEASPSPKSTSSVVPPLAPDTVPSWVLEDSSYTRVSPQYLRHTIGLAFHAETSREDRQAAVDAVDGKVVGGWRHGDGKQGLYLVRVNDDGIERLREVRRNLEAMPQVKAAILIVATSRSNASGPSTDNTDR